MMRFGCKVAVLLVAVLAAGIAAQICAASSPPEIVVSVALVPAIAY
jgi:hypothetical protein